MKKMLSFKSVLVIFSLSFFLTYTKSEEILSSTEKTSAGISLNTENVLNFLNLDIDASKATTNQNVMDSSTLENSVTSSTISNVNDLKEQDTTLSWELIYPEQNFSTTESTLSSAVNPTSSTAATNSAITESSLTNLPKYFKVDDTTNCEKYFEQCLKQVLSNVMPKLKDGNKALNLPSLDPIYFNSTAFQYNSGPFTGYITIRYALIYGLTTMKFKKISFFKTESNKFKARLSMLVPKMSAIGSYKGDMHVNNVRVRPRGDFNVTMSSLTIEMVTLGVVFSKDEHKFLRFTKNNATTILKDSKINATGIFPDKRLNDIVVNVANQYWRDLFNIVIPETRNSWLPILTDALNAALAMVPLDFLK